MLSRSLLLRSLRRTTATTTTNTIRTISSRGFPLSATIRPRLPPSQLRRRSASHVSPDLARWVSSKSLADEKIEQITELYATAQDEFEIAMEETEKMTVYAEEDRKAAREELEKVKKAYDDIINGPNEDLAEQVQKRIGQRVRELEMGIVRMEEMAQEQD